MPVSFKVEKVEEMKFKAVIFDMDGTLTETTEADYLAWERIFKDYGRSLTYEEYVPMLGIKSAEVVRTILNVTDEVEAGKCLITKSEYFTEVVAERGLKAVEGAETFLRSIKELPIKVALATSSRREKMSFVLEKVGFEKYFEVLVSGDEVTKSKPDPAIFLRAAEKLGVLPSECVVVEDAANGVKAAKKAGMQCIAITTTHSSDSLNGADVIIDSYTSEDFSSICSKLSTNNNGIAF